MSSSTRITAAKQGTGRGQTVSTRILCCFVMILAFAFAANAQTLVTPNTTTIQYLGVPNPQNNTASAVTAPLGGIILKATAISPVTGQPLRYLWVDDATSGICRIDPDLDSPGPYAINLQTCPFKVNGASITGGPMSFDPTPHFLDPVNPTVATNYLYFADEQRASEGIIRIGYLASGDSGHGALNFASLFVMGGSTTGARFGGGTTGCALPGNPGTPHSTVLDPLGNLWVGFKKSGTVVRFTQPGTASETGFGTCEQFIVPVATIDKKSDGLAFIGHDLWGADGTSPFFIKNADTTCMVPPHGICLAPTDIIGVLAAAPVGAAAVAVMSDQYYPATNGNNVYFALQQAPTVPPAAPAVQDDVAWLGNASAADATMNNTTLDGTFMGTFSPAGGPNPPVHILSGVAVDSTDPANIVAFSSEDYGGFGFLAQGQWFQSCQGNPPAILPGLGFTPINCGTPTATAAPGAPLNVTVVGGNTSATVSWSPAQSNQPVTSYKVTIITAGTPVAPVTVVPVAGSNFPATSVLISGLTNGTSYTFKVTATNAVGTSPASATSAALIPPGIAVPAAPTSVTAIPGDKQASVTFTVSPPPQGAPITSYTVTATPSGITVSIPPPGVGLNTATALVGGLTNGTTYTFTVRAVDAAGPSAPSAPSNAVTPSAAHAPVLSVVVGGPTSVILAPAQVTYTITVTNPITPTQAFPANISVTHKLTPIPAAIVPTGASRDGVKGVVTITTTGSHGLNLGQSVTIAGVANASFNGTFVLTDVPSTTTLTYSQVGPTAASGSGTVTGLPLANIVLAQSSQGTCTTGGAGVITVTCNQGSLAAGATSTMTVIVQIQSQAILNSVVVGGTDAAGTALANVNASISTTVPLPAVSTVVAPVSITGNPQAPNPNIGQAGNIIWTIANVSTTVAPNVVFTNFVPAGLRINSFTVTIDNGGVATCTGVNPPANGGTITCTTASLGGSKKNGAKPPSTMIVTVNVTPPAAGVFHPTGTVTFGPGGTNTLPNSVNLTITAK